MKKLFIVLVAVLVLFGAYMSWNQIHKTPSVNEDVQAPDAMPADAAPAPAEAAAPADPAEIRTMDFDAMRELYPADTTAVTVAGESLNWGVYRDWLRMQGLQIEDYFRQMAAYYGMSADWEGSVGDGTGMTYAQYLQQETNESLSSFLAIRAFAKENGVALDEEQRASLEPEAMAAEIVGEGATVEQLAEKLENESHMTVDAFRYYSESIMLFRNCHDALYGEGGEKVDAADVVKYLEDEGYLSAGHILFMTIDPNTGDKLDAETVAAKKQQAEEIVAELRAIEDREELVKRFLELKEQYCEDGGKTAYPDGYTFTPGTMVAAFEEAVRSLEDYGVSDPVESTYGYHVILRLPLDADSLLFSAQGTPSTARSQMAQEDLSEKLDAFYTANPPAYAEGLEALDLTQYLR